MDPDTLNQQNSGQTGARHQPALHFERRFSERGVHPYDAVGWERRDAAIKDESGTAVFEQKGVEFPEFWSAQATNVVSNKYFRGTPGTDSRVALVLDRGVAAYLGYRRLTMPNPALAAEAKVDRSDLPAS